MSNPKSKIQNPKSLCRLLFETAGDAILVMQAGRFVDCNASAAALFGAAQEELLGQSLLDFSPPTQPDGRDSEQLLQEKIEAALSGQQQRFEWLHQRPAGETFYAQLALNAVEFEAESYIQVSIYNITPYKQAEEALLEAEARYSAVVKQANDGVIIIHDNVCKFVNQAMADILGYRPAEIENTPFIKYVAPESKGLVAGRVKARLAGEEVPLVYEARLLRKDGIVIDAELSAGVVQYRGKPADVGIIRDITKRKQTEKAIQQSEANLSALIENTQDAIWSIDAEYNLLTFNSSFKAAFSLIYGLELEKGVNVVESIPPEFQLLWREHYGRALKGEQFSVEEHYDSADLSIYYEISFNPIIADNEEITGVSIYSRNITKRKQLEQQIQKSLERRGQQIRFSTQASQEIATAAREDELYRRIVTLVKEWFGFYHAQLFRCQPNMDAVVLAAGYDEIGSQMLADGYQVPLGRGLVGGAAASNASILRSDLAGEPDWQAHPLLADTKGELAVPIKLGEESVEAQAIALEYFVDHKFDGFVVTAIDPETIAPLAKKAINKGMGVLAFHTDLGADNRTAMVQVSEYEMGYNLGIQAGEWAKKHIPADQTLNVGLLNYRLVPQVRHREQAIIKGIKERFGDKVEIVGNETASNPIRGLSAAEKWLKTQPELNMIVGINDGGALGAYRAVVSAGRNDPDAFFVGGIDATDEALAAIKAGGAYQATVDIQPKATGALTMRILVAAIKGQAYQSVNTIQPVPVNLSNLDEFLEAREETMAIPGEIEGEDVLAGLDLRGIKIGLTVLSLANPFFMAFADGAKQEAERLGIELVINDPKQVLGVLAVQSDVPNRLDAEDQLALEGLCGQIATAIEGLRLRQEMEERLDELDALQRLMSREGWQKFQTRREKTGQGYLFDQSDVRPVSLDELLPAEGQTQAKAATKSIAIDGQAVTKPVAVRGEAIGALGVYDDPDNPLTPEDQAFLDSIAGQVAEAVERARLLEQSQISLAETENLYKTGRRINETSDLQEIVAAVAESEGGAIFNRALLEIFEHNLAGEIEALTVVANWHSGQGAPPTPIGVHYPLAQFPLMKLFLSREPLFFDDIQNDERVDLETLGLIQRLNVRAGAVLPLWVGKRQLGALLLEAEEIHHFTEREMRPYISLAGQVAVAIENQRLLAETSSALAKVEATQRRYTVQSWESYRAKNVAISHEQTRENVKPLGDNLPPAADQAIAHKQIAVVTNQPGLESGEASGFASTPENQPSSEAANSSVVAPLTVRDEVIGILGLQETEADRQWSPEEISLVETISEHFALAAENLRLIDATQQRAAHEKRANEIGEKIQAAQSLEEALQIAVKEVGLSLRSPQTRVKLEVK